MRMSARTSAHYVLRGVIAMREDGTFHGPLDLEIRDELIVAVGPDLPAAGAVGFDAAGVYVMPGVVDCHDHLMAASTDPLERLRQPFSQRVLECADIARRTLQAGVTCVRDAGGTDAGVRDAIAAGLVPGPHLLVSIVMLSRTGGHGDGYLLGAGLPFAIDYLPEHPGRATYIVDGPQEMRLVVREILRAGADWIKLAVTGGIASEFDDPLVAEMTAEEIGVAVTEAGLRGRRVMVHAYGGVGVDHAIAAGVGSIEHGTLINEAQAQAMAAAGIVLVPTLAILHDDIARARDGTFAPHIAQKALTMEPHLREVISLASAYGVEIALGSDAVRRDLHGRNLEEITALRRAGLPAPRALLAATSAGAKLLGLGHERGRLAPGYVADVLLLDLDPSDAMIFERPDVVRGVIQGGRAVKVHPLFLSS
jgi:imidazolonepropionase-like amidohydrolase